MKPTAVKRKAVIRIQGVEPQTIYGSRLEKLRVRAIRVLYNRKWGVGNTYPLEIELFEEKEHWKAGLLNASWVWIETIKADKHKCEAYHKAIHVKEKPAVAEAVKSTFAEQLTGRITIPASEISFDVGGHTIWVIGPNGETLMRIKAMRDGKSNGVVNVERCTTSPFSHCDLGVADDITFCVGSEQKLL